jgi:hypothetical protein
VSSLGFRYRVPVRGEAARLYLHFERPVELLNLLVADIGVAIETNRLHRRRPFKQGTRIYLHNEAFQLAAGETVEIVLRPIARPGLPPSVSVAGGLAAAALAALFLIGPLRRAGAGNELVETGETALSVERASLYDSIRDLEHDHETGKVETADFQRMRADLRAEAIDLLRQERMGEARPSSAPGSPLASQEAGGCPACREPVETDWRFCSHCGHDLRPQRGGAG